MKMIMVLDSQKLFNLTEKAVDNFKDMESKQLNNVDLKKCIDDYMRALLIYNQTMWKTTLK
jgi:hypothetical protein